MLEKLQTTSEAQIAAQERKPVDIYYSMLFKIGYVYMQPSLSITDAITLGLRIPQGLTHYRGSHTAKTIAINAYIYATYAEIPITNMTENMSAWLTVCLALERYVAMRHWNFARQYCNRRNTTRLIIGIAVVSIVFNLPYFMIHRINVQRSQNGTLKVTSSVTALKRSKFYAFYSWFRMATVQIIPLVALCILNVLLIAIVYHHNKKLDKKTELERTINRLSLGGDVLTSEEGCLSDPSKNEVVGIQQHPMSTLQKKRNAQRKLNILLIAVILLFLFGAIPQAFSYARIFELRRPQQHGRGKLSYAFLNTQNLGG
nr:Orphan Rhodopsin-like G protein-coupled receptor [Hymenolepis microstoma]